MISVHLQGKPLNIIVIQVYAPTTNAQKGEIERFYEDLQDLLELTPKKNVLFIIGNWNAKGGSQEIPGVTDKLGLGVQNEAGQMLTEFCQEDTLSHSEYPLTTTQDMTLRMDITRWSVTKSDGLYCLQSKRRSSIQSANQELGLTLVQIMSFLLQNSGFNCRK